MNLKTKDDIIRRVVCVFGKFGNDTDFVIEPACSDTCKCEICKDAFWIKNLKKYQIILKKSKEMN